ncbi:MAG: LuxR C-terminal-related transcriptional regulator [Pedococcus sp.]
MASPLVGTKLFVPPLRRTFVLRPRVGARLDHDAKLTLVSAPAGFGKTTALAAWVSAARAQGRSVAWLSCEPGEQKASVFWSYVVTAFQRIEPGVGASVLPLLESGQAPVESLVAWLVNDLAALAHDLDLVLDDYHLAESPEVAAGLQFLLEHLPPNVRVVVSTRVDPALPLARMRARGELLEVRAEDLRFTLDEVTAYLQLATGLQLDAGDVAALEQRTEGWIAALQLAALSMQGRAEPSAFIAGFTGDDRYVVDYLVDEVLGSQEGDIRSFLLQTSILDRLTGPLCDRITGRDDGKAVLEWLERANLFVVPLDDTRHWYRYHHLFAEVLQMHLRDERPSEVATLHSRACDWYDQAGEPAPAVRHALAAGDVARAADLVELAIPGERRARREATVVGWLDVIPPEVVRARPVLAMGFVSALMARNEFDTVPARLDELERLLADGPPLTVVDQTELARVPATIELYRGALALIDGDEEAIHRHTRAAVARAPVDDHVTPASAAALSGLAHWASGDLEAAHRDYTTSIEGLQQAGHLSDVLGCSITLAELRLAQGRLADAEGTYRRALDLSARQPGTLRGTPDMLVGLSQVALERGDLDGAMSRLEEARALGEPSGLPQHPYRWRVALAGVREAEGDLEGACDLLAEAERVYLGDFNPNVRPVSAVRARVLVALGRVAEAADWARRGSLSADDDLSYLRECEHLALARVLLAQSVAGGSATGLRQCLELLERLRLAAQMGERTGSVVEILTLEAVALHHGGDPYAGVPVIERALTMVESEKHVWVFAREGEPVRTLLRRLVRDRPGWDHPQRVLDFFDAGDRRGVTVATPPGAPDDVVSRQLIEPLSRRERDILRLLASDLSGPEIARELVVSVNTVRTHTRNIYSKLGVTSRRAAVRRAGELGLLSGQP